MQADQIFIQGLLVNTVIGVYDWEKQFKQPLIFDIEMSTDLIKAAQSDDIDDTVNYKTISDEVIDLVSSSRFELIESLAETVCRHIFEHHAAVKAIRLKLSKPNAVPEAQSVGLSIYRQRPEPV